MDWETWKGIIDSCIVNGQYSPCVVHVLFSCWKSLSCGGFIREEFNTLDFDSLNHMINICMTNAENPWIMYQKLIDLMFTLWNNKVLSDKNYYQLIDILYVLMINRKAWKTQT